MTVKSTNNEAKRETSQPTRAIFAGSFNPFTVGHASIVERGLKIFDRILIVIGLNAHKDDSNTAANFENIKKLYNKEPRVDVVIWKGLLVDLAKQENIRVFLRGIRNSTDFDYETAMADINRKIGEIETVFLPALPEHTAITSSVVRELKHYGADTSSLLPTDVK